MKHVKFNGKIYFFILGIFLAVTLVVGAIFIGCDFSKFTDDSTVDTEDTSLAEVNLKKEGKINVLLLGVDVEGLRTDAMMIASYDIDNSTVNLLSIPRDTRMYVGTKYQKINAAHAIGGMKGKIAGPEGSIEAVTRLTGIPIHYYIEFSFKAIDNFIDVLGGVDFEVPDIEGKGRGMNYDDPYQNLHIHLKPGMQHLKGNQVQQLLRYRKSSLVKGVGYADGDRGRIEMQQEFVKALVEQKLNAKLILKLPDIFEQLSNDLKTNFTVSDIAKYAGYLKGFSSDKITAYQLPGVSNGTDYGASYWICDLEQTKTLVEDVFGYDASKITIDSPDGKSKSKDKKSTASKNNSTSTKATASPTSVPKEDNEIEEPLVQANSISKNKDEKSTPTPKPTSKPSETEKTASTDEPEKTEKPTTVSDSKDNKSETEHTAAPNPESTPEVTQTTAPTVSNKNQEDIKPETTTAPSEVMNLDA